jgi:hypothetical protein
MSERILCDAAARVADREHRHIRVVANRRDCDTTSAGRELHCVLREVLDDLRQAGGIADNPGLTARARSAGIAGTAQAPWSRVDKLSPVGSGR